MNRCQRLKRATSSIYRENEATQAQDKIYSENPTNTYTFVSYINLWFLLITSFVLYIVQVSNPLWEGPHHSPVLVVHAVCMEIPNLQHENTQILHSDWKTHKIVLLEWFDKTILFPCQCFLTCLIGRQDGPHHPPKLVVLIRHFRYFVSEHLVGESRGRC